MEFPPLEETDYIKLAKWPLHPYSTTQNYYLTKDKWKNAKDRDFCLSVLDENRLFVTGLLDPQDNTNNGQTWIYTKGKGWAKSTPMPKQSDRVTSGSSCERITTKEDCETAARELGLSDAEADVNDDASYPPYCYFHKSGHLIFNTNGQATAPCSDLRSCICKTASRWGVTCGVIPKVVGQEQGIPGE